MPKGAGARSRLVALVDTVSPSRPNRYSIDELEPPRVPRLGVQRAPEGEHVLGARHHVPRHPPHQTVDGVVPGRFVERGEPVASFEAGSGRHRAGWATERGPGPVPSRTSRRHRTRRAPPCPPRCRSGGWPPTSVTTTWCRPCPMSYCTPEGAGVPVAVTGKGVARVRSSAAYGAGAESYGRRRNPRRRGRSRRRRVAVHPSEVLCGYWSPTTTACAPRASPRWPSWPPPPATTSSSSPPSSTTAGRARRWARSTPGPASTTRRTPSRASVTCPPTASTAPPPWR